MKVRLTHLDGRLPNLALMKLAHWHLANGDQVVLKRTPSPDLFEGTYGRVYGSAIFEWTKPVVKRLQAAFPDAIVGGTAVDYSTTVEQITGEYEHYDYSLYPDFPHSIGFSQRGCRLRCGFCVVPKKEGKPRPVNSIRDIWRGEPHPRNILLLDNDFFGAEGWQDKIAEIREGGFRVSFSQGINIRMVNEESAAAIASIEYRDDGFKSRRLYTAWDNAKEERRFFNGVSCLNRAGVPSKHLMVYMLCGYWPGETLDDVLDRFGKLKAAGCLPYPMVYEKWRPEMATLRRFQHWAIRRYHEVIPDFREYDRRKQRQREPDSIPMVGV